MVLILAGVRKRWENMYSKQIMSQWGQMEMTIQWDHGLMPKLMDCGSSSYNSAPSHPTLAPGYARDAMKKWDINCTH